MLSHTFDIDDDDGDVDNDENYDQFRQKYLQMKKKNLETWVVSMTLRCYETMLASRYRPPSLTSRPP